MIKIELPDLDTWWAEVREKHLTERFPGVRIKPADGLFLGARSPLH